MKTRLQQLLIIALVFMPSVMLLILSINLRSNMIKQETDDLRSELFKELQSNSFIEDYVSDSTRKLNMLLPEVMRQISRQKPSDKFIDQIAQMGKAISKEIAAPNSIAFTGNLMNRQVCEFSDGSGVASDILGSFTAMLFSALELNVLKSPSFNETLVNTEQFLRQSLGFYFNFRSLNGHFHELNWYFLREESTLSLLTSLYYKTHFIANLLINLTNIDESSFLKAKVEKFNQADMGLAAMHKSNYEIMLSEYFATRERLAETVTKLLKSNNEYIEVIQTDDHMLAVSGNDPKRDYNLSVVAPLPQIDYHPMTYLFFALILIASTFYAVKLCRAIETGSLFKLSLTAFLIRVFLMVTLLPLIGSMYIANEYIINNFKAERNRSAQSLETDIAKLDTITGINLRKTVQLLKSMNSIELWADFASVDHNTPVAELLKISLDKMLKQNNKALVTHLYIFSYQDGLQSVVLEQQKNRNYLTQPVTNPFFETLFNNRLESSILTDISRLTSSSPKQGSEINTEELKSELVDELYFNTAGQNTYFKLQEDLDSIVKLEAFKARTAILSVPITSAGKVSYIFNWMFDSSELRAHFPTELLRKDEKEPLDAMFEANLWISLLKHNVYEFSHKFPELFALARKARSSMSRLVAQINTNTGNKIIEATASKITDHVLVGQKFSRDMISIRNELYGQTFLIVAIILLIGLIMAITTALYFTSPINQLIKATNLIINGQLNARLDEAQPDDFGEIALSFNKMARGMSEGELLKTFVSKSVQQLASKEDGYSKASISKATVLFSGIKGFSALHEHRQPAELFRLLQEHLKAAVEAVKVYGGEIEKMIEDKVMIVFMHDEVENADEAALNVALHLTNALKKSDKIDLSIGINTGDVVSGVMGAETVRLAKTVVGDPVNLAARLAAVAAQQPERAIVTSTATVENAGKAFLFELLPINQVKGKTQSVKAYILKQS